MRIEKELAAVRVFAIVPAAGLGRRMADAAEAENSPPKALRDVGGQPMLVRVIDALATANVQCIIVVVNAAIENAIRSLRPGSERLRYVVNPRPEGEMIESVQLGLAEVLATQHAALTTRNSAPLLNKSQTRRGEGGQGGAGRAIAEPPACGFLICPGDHPCVSTKVIEQCVMKFSLDPSQIVIASYEGRRGHPLILPADLAVDVLSWPPTQRLNELRSRHPERVEILDVSEPGILIDVDTPADLAEARQNTEGRSVHPNAGQ